MQVFDNLALEEVQAINLDASATRQKEIIRMILQELVTMGYDDVGQILEQESQTKLDISQISELKDSFINGEYELILSSLDFSEQRNKKLQYEIQKQLFIEIVQQKNFEQAVNLLRQLSEFNETESQILSKLIFLQDNQPFVFKQLSIPIDQQEQRRQLYLKTLNYLNFNNFSLNTQFDKIIQEATQFQYKRCPFHYEQNENENESILTDHNCQNYSLPQYNHTVYQQFDDEVWIAKFSNNGQWVGCATKQNSIYILSKEKQHKITKAHLKDINSLIFSQDDTLLFSASNDCQIHCYSVHSAQPKFIIKDIHQTSVLCLSYFKNQLFSGGVDNWIGIWSNEGKLIQQIKSKIVKNIHFTNQYMLLHNASATQITVIENDNKFNKIITQLDEQELIIQSALSSNQQYLILNVSKEQPKMNLWNLKNFNKIRIFAGFQIGDLEIKCCFGGRQDNYVCIGSLDGKIYCFNRNNQLQTQVIEGHKSAIGFVDWSNAENSLLTASDDRTVKLWSQEPTEKLVINVPNQQENNQLIQIDEQQDDDDEEIEMLEQS